MKVVLLAGGYGTRISEQTSKLPKPMIEIGGLPILIHIMKIFSNFGHNEFYIALGYKSKVIKDFFLNYKSLGSDISINFNSGKKNFKNSYAKDWTINLIETGLDTKTGSRLKKLKKYLNNEKFFLTYGDGLANVNIDRLLNFHNKNNKVATLTSVRPNVRFGEIQIDSKTKKVKKFYEKKQLSEGWINGGFFVFEPEIFDYLPNKNVMLEREPMNELTKKSQLMAYQHKDFWQCMDTQREYEYLNSLAMKKKIPWHFKK